MVDRIRTRNLWGRITAPSRVKRVKRRKEDESYKQFQEQLDERKDKGRQDDRSSIPSSTEEASRPRETASSDENKTESGKSKHAKKTGGNVDIHI